MNEGEYLVGLPVGVAIDADGRVTLTVYAEDLGVALSEDDATPEHIAAAEALLANGTALNVVTTVLAEEPPA